MIETSHTLLECVRSRDNQLAWDRFYRTYAGVIVRYAQKLGSDANTAEDILQESMVILMNRLQAFDYQPEKGKFRNYVFTIVHRTCLKHFRRKRPDVSLDAPETEHHRAKLELLADPNTPDLEDRDLRTWRRSIIEQAMENLRRDTSLQPSTLEVFERLVIQGQPAAVVCRQCGVKENAAYQIKHRMTERLRREVTRIAGQEPG